MKHAILVALVAVATAACANKTEPNKRNFSAAIDTYLERKGEVCLGGEEWPLEIKEYEGENTRRYVPKERAVALEAAGLVSSTRTENPPSPKGPNRSAHTQIINVYDLNEKGRSFFRGSTPKSRTVWKGLKTFGPA